MKTPTPAPDAHHAATHSKDPKPPDPPLYDPRLLAAALNAFAAVVRWLDHHMEGWLM